MNIIQGILSSVRPLPDGDFSDKLSYCISTVGLIVASAFVSGWSFVGNPIQCWFPAYYKGWWMEYALDYCYVQNTYFAPFTDVKPHNHFDIANHIVPIPKNITEREQSQLGYYQWVPFIFAAQAFFFYLPVVIWRTIYETAGHKVATICQTCAISSNMDEDERKKNIKIVSGFLVYEHTISSTIGGRVKKLTGGSYLISSYLLTKVLFALNAVAQFVFLKFALGVDSYFWGWEVFQDLCAGIEWPETGKFPRVTMCDFSVRELGNLHRHSVQCVLMINMFNEKIFVALWFWLAFLAVYSLYSLIYWLVTSVTIATGRKIVNNYIEKIDSSVYRSAHRKSLLNEFVTEKLRPDGVFLVRLISKNSGDMVTCALLDTMWKDFVQERGSHPPPYTEPLLLGKKDIAESDL